MNFAPIELAEAKKPRLDDEVRYIFHLISSLSILPVCELYLNYTKIPKTGVAGTSGIGTTLFGTGTDPVLEGGTGTVLGGTGTIFPLHQGYRYHPKGVPVPVSDSAQKWKNSPFLIHFSSMNHFYYILHQKLTWNPSKQLHQHF